MSAEFQPQRVMRENIAGFCASFRKKALNFKSPQNYAMLDKRFDVINDIICRCKCSSSELLMIL
jgi:hypothetical protein